MKCPHCHKFSERSAVIETRRGDTVYRRRRCSECLQTFITVETVYAEGGMPDARTRNRGRRAAMKENEGVISRATTGAHLQNIW